MIGLARPHSFNKNQPKQGDEKYEIIFIICNRLLGMPAYV